MIKRLVAIIILVILAACAAPPSAVPIEPVSGLPAGSRGLPWWNDTVFYQIFVRSFYDSDGDGIGDLNGIIEKLDYLNDGNPKTDTDLGVTGIWLMPIHPATSYHGYDVTDYYAIHPEYGSLDDFKRLISLARQRGIRVIIDLVINHTSIEHPWFQAAQDPNSEYREWYVWSETEPTGSGWHASPSGLYYGIFWEGMPDLNFSTPAVTSQMQEIARFWLEEVGVDGFRIDAAKHLVEEGSIQSHANATYDWFRAFRPFYKNLNPQALTVGEIWDSSVAVSKYLTGDQLDLAFSFDLAEAYVTSARVGRADQAVRILNRELRLFQLAGESGAMPYQFATFLTNHDQARVMTLMADTPEKAKTAASLLLTSPGVPFIYYGEEIGMLGMKPDELIRTPMQWSGQTNGGFSLGEPWQPLNADFASKNVFSQATAPDSLLSHYRSLIRLRNQHIALRSGETYTLESCGPGVIAVLRAAHETSPPSLVLSFINLSADPAPDCSFNLSEGPLSGNYSAVILMDSSRSANAPAALKANASGGFDAYRPVTRLEAFQTLIIQLLSQP